MKTGKIRMIVGLLSITGFLVIAFGSPVMLYLFPDITTDIDNKVEILLNPPPSAEDFEEIKKLKEIEPLIGKILFQSYHEGELQIYMMNTDGSDTTRMTNDGAKFAKVSPDGTKIAFTKPQHSVGNEGNGLLIMGVDGSKPIKICNMAIDEFFSWSPDGKWIVFTSPDWLNNTSAIPEERYDYACLYDIYVISIETGELIRLTTEGGRYPVWSPDGEEIYFVSTRNRNNTTNDEKIKQDIFKMNADGSEQVQILITRKEGTTTPSPRHISLSPDGKKIAFDAYTLNQQICTIDVNGNNLTTIAFVSQYVQNRHPEWSDKGIVFSSARNNEPWTIYTMNPDGSDVKKVGDGISYSTHPTWSPS